MITDLSTLLENNKNWADRMVNEDPEFFLRLSDKQEPRFLWIGCSDSRVPANEMIGARPGEVFLHRNIANQVQHGDLNMLSVLQYAVLVLKVRHIIVCGHYGCGGVKASLEYTDHGLVDHWIRPIKQIYLDQQQEFLGLDESGKLDLLCEWNVRQQVLNVAQTPILQKAWLRGQKVFVHGLIYGLSDGKLKDLSCSIGHPGEVPSIYQLQ